jgi:hypothetical protein
MGAAAVCGAKHAEDEGAHRAPVEHNPERAGGRPPLAPGNNQHRPHAIDTNIAAKQPQVRLSTPHQKIRVSSIDYTPIGEDKKKYPYNCPLCFFYFSTTIFETSCCKNYVCEGCAVDFLKGKEGLPEQLNGVPKRLPAAVCCPHCGTSGVNLQYVSQNADVRSYQTSPTTKAKIESLNESPSTAAEVSNNVGTVPLKENALSPRLITPLPESGSPSSIDNDRNQAQDSRMEEEQEDISGTGEMAMDILDGLELPGLNSVDKLANNARITPNKPILKPIENAPIPSEQVKALINTNGMGNNAEGGQALPAAEPNEVVNTNKREEERKDPVVDA